MTTNMAGNGNVVEQAAALLEAVARDCETAADFEVPFRAGLAANQLHALMVGGPAELPFVGDHAADVHAAITDALRLLATLPDEDLSEQILDAIADADAALAAMGTEVRH